MAVPRNIFLANHLRHVGTHNKVQEEREMWRLRKLELNASLHSSLDPTRTKTRVPITTGRLLSDSYRESDQEDYSSELKERDELKTETKVPSYYWTRQLMKAEELDSHRWGHSGYKEHHPEEFISTDDEDDPNNEDRRVRCGSKRKKRRTEKKRMRLKHSDEFSSDEKGKSRKKSPKKRLKEKRKKKKKLKER